MKTIRQGVQRFGFEGNWTCKYCDHIWEMESTDPKPQCERAEGIHDEDIWIFNMPFPNCTRMTYRHANKERHR